MLLMPVATSSGYQRSLNRGRYGTESTDHSRIAGKNQSRGNHFHGNVQAVFRRIDAVEKDVHAYILLTREKALEGAAHADEEIKKGNIKTLTGYSDLP